MIEPLVSVIVPVFAGERFLGDALGTVLAQTYPRIETIVVDDGSPDRSAEIAAAREGVRVLREPHRGVAAARNAGLSAARGELIAFLDQDDLWHAHKLAAQVAALAARPQLAIVLTPHGDDARAGHAAPGLVRIRVADRADSRLRAEHVAGAPGGVRARGHVRHELRDRVRLRLARRAPRTRGLASEMLAEVLVRWRVHGGNGTYDQATMRRETLRMLRGTARRQREARRGRLSRLSELVIPVWNGERWLGEALDSVLAQRQRPIDVVVVDDGSSDQSAAIAEDTARRCVSCARRTQAPALRATAASGCSRASWSTFLDADDLLTPVSIACRCGGARAPPGDRHRVRAGVPLRREARRRAGRVERTPAWARAGDDARPQLGARTGRAVRDRHAAWPRDWTGCCGRASSGSGELALADQVAWRRVHGENNSLRNRAEIGEFAHALKASLDRRRAAHRPNPEAGR